MKKLLMRFRVSIHVYTKGKLIVVTGINGMEGELEPILQTVPMPIDR